MVAMWVQEWNFLSYPKKEAEKIVDIACVKANVP